MPKKALPNYIKQYENRVEGLALCSGVAIDDVRYIANTILGLISCQRHIIGAADEYRLFLMLDTSPKAKMGFWNFCLVSDRTRRQWLCRALRELHPNRKEVA